MSKYLFTYKAKELLSYIDWNYFFHAWDIKPKDYTSKEATLLKKEAVALVLEKTPVVKSLFRLCDAYSIGDNLMIEGILLPLLRQQHNAKERPNLCLSDFVSPRGDKIGIFATAVSHSFEEERNECDPYRSMLIQTIADRLAEAATSAMHMKVRTTPGYWGYAPNEKSTPEDLKYERYQGIRPAIGYPSLPDQSVIFILDKILNLQEAGIKLTESGAMIPHASVCGIMISHPAAQYFAVGNISEEQLHDYCSRRGASIEEIGRYLVKNI